MNIKVCLIVEFNKYACESLRENFDTEKVFFGDIKDFNLESLDQIDIVAGGSPCQPFSLGGKHKAEQDNRDMFPHSIRAIEKLKSKAFLFENVKGLLRPNFSDYFELGFCKAKSARRAAGLNLIEIQRFRRGNPNILLALFCARILCTCKIWDKIFNT